MIFLKLRLRQEPSAHSRDRWKKSPNLQVRDKMDQMAAWMLLPLNAGGSLPSKANVTRQELGTPLDQCFLYVFTCCGKFLPFLTVCHQAVLSHLWPAA